MLQWTSAVNLTAVSVFVTAIAVHGGATKQESSDPGVLARDFVKKHSSKDTLDVMATCAARADEAAASLDEWSATYWKSLAQFSVAASNPADAKKSEFTAHKPVKGHASDDAHTWPSPHVVTYRFGTRDLFAIDSKAKELQAVLKKNDVVTSKLLPTEERLANLLRGCRPDLELIVAGIERSLDIHREYDTYAQFLESWRNYGSAGDESFYQALDRTAGSNEAVFFYDSMLADFVFKFAGEDGKRWSLDQRHDHNQATFLSYRQYRGLIEAVAYSLALPPDVPLPRRLARYDHFDQGEGVYALRDQLDLLLALDKGDVGAVVERMRKHLAATLPPKELWEPYLVSDAFITTFQELIPEVVKTMEATSTDQLLENVRTQRKALKDGVRTAVDPLIVGS